MTKLVILSCKIYSKVQRLWTAPFLHTSFPWSRCAAGLFLRWCVRQGRRRASDRAATEPEPGSWGLTARCRCLFWGGSWNASLLTCQTLKINNKSHLLCTNLVSVTHNTYCLNFWRMLWSGVPSTLWILETWSNSLVPGKRGFKLKQMGMTSTNKAIYTAFVYKLPTATPHEPCLMKPQMIPFPSKHYLMISKKTQPVLHMSILKL